VAGHSRLSSGKQPRNAYEWKLGLCNALELVEAGSAAPNCNGPLQLKEFAFDGFNDLLALAVFGHFCYFLLLCLAMFLFSSAKDLAYANLRKDADFVLLPAVSHV
jgi:hypothetical protein